MTPLYSSKVFLSNFKVAHTSTHPNPKQKPPEHVRLTISHWSMANPWLPLTKSLLQHVRKGSVCGQAHQVHRPYLLRCPRLIQACKFSQRNNQPTKGSAKVGGGGGGNSNSNGSGNNSYMVQGQHKGDSDEWWWMAWRQRVSNGGDGRCNGNATVMQCGWKAQ